MAFNNEVKLLVITLVFIGFSGCTLQCASASGEDKNKCYADAAADSGNWALCDQAPIRNNCIAYAAQKTMNPEACDSLGSDENLLRNCYVYSILLNNTDIHVCSTFGTRTIGAGTTVSPSVTYTDYCYALLAKNTNDEKVCERIADSTTKALCKSYTNPCTSVPDSDKDKCYGDDAASSGNWALCDQSPIKNNCILYAARKTMNPEACDSISTDENMRYNCYYYMFENNKDINSCSMFGTRTLGPGHNLPPSVTYTEACYSIVAKNTNDGSVCERIANEEFRQTCGSAFNKTN